MTLIKSISGIRGTIGGNPEDGLNPLAIVKFVAAYATFIKKNTKVTTNKIVVGRDARISGPMVKQVVLGALTGMGFDVVDIDLATTPTTELAVAGIFIKGSMRLAYGTSVPAGWLVALKYVRDRAHVKLIVPSKMGQQQAMERVYPCYYDIHKFQIWN